LRIRIIVLVFSAALFGYLGLSAYTYHLDKRYAKDMASVTAGSAEGLQIRNLLNQKSCYYCHASNYTLPPYASLPGIKQLSAYDVKTGLKHFKLDALFASLQNGTPAPQADLAKIEAAIKDNTMPPLRFRAVHWASSLDQAERKMLLDWIASQRESHYITASTAPEFRNEPVQPLPKLKPVDSRKVTLGRQLFNDPRLSKDNTVSCASCHMLSQGGADSRKRSIGVGGKIGPINAPTVFNAVLNHSQFWDGRARTLQDQAGGPPLNPIEMASESWDEIAAKLDRDPVLTRAFKQVYPDGYSGLTITDAIAEFEKTLTTPSRFDNYLKGDKTALTSREARGYMLFKTNKCATCHVGSNLGGQSFEQMGLKADYFVQRGEPLTDADLGRYNVTQKERDRYRFKTPTLRNIELTQPYFHDGSVDNLHEAVRIMLKYQVGKTLPEQDVNDIVAFLKTLTGSYEPTRADQERPLSPVPIKTIQPVAPHRPN
jgi:cytochrome c peroxidase